MDIQPQLWHSVPFTASTRVLIQNRVQDIAHRLSDARYVENVGQLATYQSKFSKGKSHFPMQSLSHGRLGLALLYGELDRVFPGEGWDRLAHSSLALLYDKLLEIKTDSQDLSLFTGTCGILFIAHYLSHEGKRYNKLCSQIESVVLPEIAQFLSSLPYTEHLLPILYNLPSGAIGISLTLLSLTQATYRPELPSGMGLNVFLRHMVWLAQQSHYSEKHVFNHWYIMPELRDRQTVYDTTLGEWGLRSGLAGHIALLSLAAKSGQTIDVAGIPEALRILCKDLRQHIRKGEYGWGWPQEETGDDAHRPGKTALFAWCNGTSGIARALWLAGDVLNDNELRTLALECIAGATRFCQQEILTVGPSLCHGLAGLILSCLHFVHETGDPTLAQDVLSMTDRLLELFEADRPFGYRVFEPGYIRVDSPWFLEGAAGIALVLLATISPIPPAWDHVLLLS